MCIKECIMDYVRLLLLPTRVYIKRKKSGLGESARSELIRGWTTGWLIFSLIICVCFLVIPSKFILNNIVLIFLSGLCAYVAFSRANEILGAFLQDSFDKLEEGDDKEEIRYSERIKLALGSYGELILDFAIIYYFLNSILSSKFTFFDNKFNSIIEAIYFSGATITTLGSNIYPKYWITQLLSIYEVIDGMVLLFFTLAIYVSAANKIKKNN